MNNWSSGWRVLVVWDTKNRYYLYKNNKILPLSYQEQRDMPLHLQNEYYWDEINRIDHIEDLKSKETILDTPENPVDNPVDKVLDLLFKYWEE